MIFNYFKPFSNFRILQFLQSENPAPLPFRQKIQGGRYPQHPPAVYTASRAVAYIMGSPAALQSLVRKSSFHLPLIIGDLPLHFLGQLFLTRLLTRGSSPSIALNPAGQLPPRVPRSGGVPGRTEGNSSPLFHECRGADLNCGPLDFQSRSPWPLYKKSPGALSK
jgi:hypothetical protein